MANVSKASMYQQHRAELLKLTEVFQSVEVEAKEVSQVRNSMHRFMKEESKFKLTCKNIDGKYMVIALKRVSEDGNDNS